MIKLQAPADVFVVHPFDAHAGSQRVVQQIHAALRALKHRCRVHLGFGSRGFVSELPQIGRFLPVNSIPWRKRLYPLWIMALMPRIVWAVLRGEVVWANTVHAIPAVLPALLLAPRRVIVHLHEIEFPGIFLVLVRWSLQRGARVLCVSQVHRRALAIDAELLPNCVAVRSEASPMQPPVILFVGAMSQMKGFELFVDVAKILAPGGLRLVAYVPSVPAGAEDLDRAARLAGVEVRCGVRDAAAIYPGAALLLQCTDPTQATETFSLVMAEALSCGVPVATAGMDVASEILGEAWAFDVPDRDPVRMAALVHGLMGDATRMRTLREAALARREKFAFPAYCDRVGALMRSIQ